MELSAVMSFASTIGEEAWNTEINKNINQDALSSLLLLSQVKSGEEDIEQLSNGSHDDVVEEDASVQSISLDSPNKDVSVSLGTIMDGGIDSSAETNFSGTRGSEDRGSPGVHDEKNTPITNNRRAFTMTTPAGCGTGSQPLGGNSGEKGLMNLSSSSGNIALDDLRRYFHLPIAEVARQFGTCTTALKKICRKLNISKWPYRQILSLTKSIQSLEMASLNDNLEDELKVQYKEQILVLQKAIGEVLKNPNKPIDSLNLSNITFGAGNTSNELDVGDDEDNDPSAPEVAMDVQHIIKAAAQTISQPERISLIATSSSSKKNKSKRKIDGAGEFGESEINGESSTGSQQIQQLQIDELTKKLKLPVPPSMHSFTSLAMEFATADFDNGPHGPLLEVGATKVQHNPRYENQKYQFSGPVQLAPLVRKKMRPNANRRVVPLMEPDIGSNYSIEFIPQLIVSMLHKSLEERTPGGADNLPTNSTNQ